MVRSSRKVHKYLSLAISVQLLLWTVSGIYFSFNKIEDVRGNQYLKPVEIIEAPKGNKISHENRILNLCANFFFNFSIVKRYFINDTLAKSLLRHCCEEMNHLSIFLPELYKDISRSSNSS